MRPGRLALGWAWLFWSLLPSWAWAQQSLGRYQDWEAFFIEAAQGRQCFIIARPHLQLPKGAQRTDAYFMLTHRPGEGIRDEISLHLGRRLVKDSPARLAVGAKVYRMLTQDERAWSRDAPMDKVIVEDMLKAALLRIEHDDPRGGRRASDVYRLDGFSAARQASMQACPAS